MKEVIIKIILISFCLGPVACSDKGDHMPLDTVAPTEPSASKEKTLPQPTQETSETSGPSFDRDVKPIFAKYCASCHKAGSGLPDWLDYQQASAKKDRILNRAVITKTMPPPGMPQLQPSEIHAIGEWIEHGALKGDDTVVLSRAATTPRPVTEIPITSPTLVTVERPVPQFYCEEQKYYDNDKIKSNRILVAKLSENFFVSAIATSLTFDRSEGLKSVENTSLLKSFANQNMLEVCGVVIRDKNKCLMDNSFTSQANANLQITCDGDTPVHLNIAIKDSVAKINCTTPSTQTTATFNRCGYFVK